jgi:hypothetical protein
LLTGRPPFQGPSIFDIVVQVREQPPVPPSQVRPGMDRDLEAVCLKCLAKDPCDRYASAEALALDLESWLAGKPLQARPPSAGLMLWLWLRHNSPTAGWVLLLGVLYGLGSSFVVFATFPRLMANANDAYAKFPSLEQPWTTAIPWSLVEKLTIVFALLNVAMEYTLGLLVALSVRPKDLWSAAVAGIAVRLIAAVVLFTIGMGPAFVLERAVIRELGDLELLATAFPVQGEAAADSATFIRRIGSCRIIRTWPTCPNLSGPRLFGRESLRMK